jgi:tRNA 2-thiouridine synthesizing protein A
VPDTASANTASDDTLLDARGWTCPLPVLRARKLLKAMPIGENLQILATDPGSVRDFEAFCRQTGNTLLESREDTDGVYHYRIKKVV